MKAKAEVRGVIESGFKRAEDGWHIVKFLEGIDQLKDKEGKVSTNKQGDINWKLPLVVDDPEDESNEIEIDVIVSENKKGEQTVTNFLGATGLAAAFDKAFPGDVSVFDGKVADKIKVKLPGQYMRVKTKQNSYKDKTGQEQIAVNIIGFGKISDTVDALEKALFPVKEGKAVGKPAGEKKSAVADDDGF
jgi:hypothetical protein